MGLKCFTYAFNLKASSFWPPLKRRQAIPSACKSRHNTGEAHLGLGLVEAVSILLTAQVDLGRDGEAFSVRYESNRGGRRVATGRPHRGPSPHASAGARVRGKGPLRIWSGTDAMKAPAILCVIEAMLLETTGGKADPELDEVRERWVALLEELELEIMQPAPHAKYELIAASKSDLCQRAVMALTDAIYFALKRSHSEKRRQFLSQGGSELPAMSSADVDRLMGRPPAQTRRTPPGDALARTLIGLIETGGTALLVGPTGTFKTTTAARVAAEAGAHLQVVKGRPGIEDRDFFGGVVPTESGPAWVDGPVTKAFRQACSGKAMLLMDELLRFEPLYLGALIGLLDPASPAELSAREIEPAPAFEQAAHYVAELPTGERIACPTRQLTLVATTNMGSDYVQAARLDAALMGRFELTVEVETPDPALRRHLYEQAAGAKGADLLEAIEEAVGAGHIDQGGLYVRKAHPRLMLNMARQMERLTRGPLKEANADDLKRAALEAARVTIVPGCVERQTIGLLEPSGREALLRQVGDCAEDIL